MFKKEYYNQKVDVKQNPIYYVCRALSLVIGDFRMQTNEKISSLMNLKLITAFIKICFAIVLNTNIKFKKEIG